MRDKYPTVNQDDEFLERFRDHWHAKAGKDAMKRDWDAAYRNWVRNAAEWNTNGHRNRSPNTGQPSAHERKKAIAADIFKALGNNQPPELT
jgi:hypothetical protein